MIVSLVISISAVTGKFPPRKDDIIKGYQLGVQLYQKNKEFQAAQKGLTAQQTDGEQVLSGSLEQMTRLQELNLQRMKAAVELTKIFNAFPTGVPSEQLDIKIREVSVHLQAVEKGLAEIQIQMLALPKQGQWKQYETS